MLPAAVRAAADLDAHVACRANERGDAPRFSWISRAMPRDWVTARRHDSAPGQLVTSVIDAAPGSAETGNRQAAIERGQLAAAHPPQHHVLLWSRTHQAVAVGFREQRRARATGLPSNHPAASVTVTIECPGCFCGRTLLAARPCARRPDRRHERPPPEDARPVHLHAFRQLGNLPRPTERRIVSTRRFFLRRVLGVERKLRHPFAADRVELALDRRPERVPSHRS